MIWATLEGHSCEQSAGFLLLLRSEKNVRSFYLPTANRRLPSMSKTAAMKTSKALETPKAKAQGEVDYKAKIDVVIETFSSKVTRGPACAPVHCCACTMP